MKNRIWENIGLVMASIAITCSIFFQAKRLIYATDMWVYSESAIYCLGLAVIFMLAGFIYNIND
jgi:hypothetical protein